MRQPFHRILYVQVLLAIAAGVLLGHLYPLYPRHATAMKPLGDAFIKLIRMDISGDPSGRALSGEQVAAAVLQLASAAAMMITGTILRIDGGLDGAVTFAMARILELAHRATPQPKANRASASRSNATPVPGRSGT